MFRGGLQRAQCRCQEHSLKTSLSWPRGKVLGGSSALNGMIYIRGAKADFDNWAYNGAAGWSYDQVLPFFKKSEDFEEGASHYHGAGGPLPVTRIHEPNPASLAFLEACAGYGVPLNDDPNADSIMGAGLAARPNICGRACSRGRAFRALCDQAGTMRAGRTAWALAAPRATAAHATRATSSTT